MSDSESKEDALFSTSLRIQRQKANRGKSSPLISAGVALSICFFMSLAAILESAPETLAWLTLANLLLILLHRLDRQVLARGLRICLWQTLVVAGLYLLRYGPAAGLVPGLRVSWQLLLVFLPGLVLFSGTTANQLTQALSKVLPARSAFVLGTSLKFLPLLVTEMAVIYEAQCLRGARIKPRQLLWPGNWGDLLHCLAAPVVVRVLEIANDIASAARAREFGRFSTRTCWPGNQEHTQ